MRRPAANLPMRAGAALGEISKWAAHPRSRSDRVREGWFPELAVKLQVSRKFHLTRALCVGRLMVILIFRPQTAVRSGTRHVQYDIEQGSGPGFHTESVYSHLRVLHSRQNVELAIFGLFGSVSSLFEVFISNMCDVSV